MHGGAPVDSRRYDHANACCGLDPGNYLHYCCVIAFFRITLAAVSMWCVTFAVAAALLLSLELYLEKRTLVSR